MLPQMQGSVSGACQQCGRDFIGLYHQGIAPKYCSNACRLQVFRFAAVGAVRQKNIAQFTCEECKTVVSANASYAKKRKYCSYKCAGLARTRLIRGPAHPAWKGGTKRGKPGRSLISSIVKQRGKCAHCGATQNLQGHHKEHFAKAVHLRHDPDNIEVLCGPCHAKEHVGLEKLIDRKFHRKGKNVPCAFCRELTYIQTFKIIKGGAIFCSKECRMADDYIRGVRLGPIKARGVHEIGDLLCGMMGVL